MPASPFSILPDEIICQIFESTADFSVVAALAKTARIFYHIWRENATSICWAVGSRAFLTPADAERLVDIQEAAEAGSQPQEDRGQKPILRAKRLLRNARGASAVSHDWVELCGIHGWRDSIIPWNGDIEQDWHMRPHEIARFEHAFYSVWTIGIMETTPHLKDQASAFLDKCTPRELCQLNEFTDWAIYTNENWYQSWGLEFKDEVWKIGCDLVRKRWWAYRDKRGYGVSTPDNTFMGMYAFFDETQRYLDLMEEQDRQDMEKQGAQNTT
jgi:hypothetical protein